MSPHGVSITESISCTRMAQWCSGDTTQAAYTSRRVASQMWQNTGSPLYSWLIHPLSASVLPSGVDQDRQLDKDTLAQKVQHSVQQSSHRVLLVTPKWPARSWFPLLSSLVDGMSWQLPPQSDGMIRHPQLSHLHLWVCPQEGSTGLTLTQQFMTRSWIQ